MELPAVVQTIKDFGAKVSSSKSRPGGKELDLTVVLPVLNEEENVARLVDELVAQLDGMDVSYEIIGINMQGRDNSYEVLKDLGEKYKNFYPVDGVYLQTKGYQKSYQYMLGFSLARGKRVFQMDSDYQDDPADIPKFLEKLDEGYDMVTGWKQDRKDPFFYKLTSKMQNFVSRMVTGIKVHDKNCGFKAYERSAMASLNLYGMNYRDIPMQLAARGFKVAEVPINNRKRISGKSNFTFLNRLIGGTLDFTAALVTSMLLDKPFRLFGMIGLVNFVLGAIVLGGFAVWVVVTGGSLSLNWYTVLWVVVGVVFALASVMWFATGMVAEYMRSLKDFSVEDYHIKDDPKGRVK